MKEKLEKLQKVLDPENKREHGVTPTKALEHLYFVRKDLGEKNTKLKSKVRTLVTRNEVLEKEIATLTAKPVQAVETQPDLPVKTDAETPTGVGETSTKTKATVQDELDHHSCKFFTMGEDDLVHCAKDYDAKGLIHRVTLDVCTQDWKRVQERKQMNATLGPQLPCVSRIEYQNADLYCGRNAPKLTKLAFGVKACASCPHRMTEAIAEAKGITLWTHTYVTCGGAQKKDPKVGLQIQCRAKGNEWVNIAFCKKQECPKCKTVRYQKV